MDAHEDADGQAVPGLKVFICEGCQEGYHSHCVRDRYGPTGTPADRGHANVAWLDPALVARRSVWRCGDCVEDNCWGVRSLVESMLTFNTTRCSAESAAYSVLTHFHADTSLPEACFVHGCVPRERTRTAISRMKGWWTTYGADRDGDFRRAAIRTRSCLASWTFRPRQAGSGFGRT